MESASHLRTLLRRIVLADNDRLAAPSAPTSFKRGAPSLRVRPSDAKTCCTSLGRSGPMYTKGGHRRKRTTARGAKESTPALPRVFVSTSNVSVRPSPPPRTSQVCNWPLIIALAPFLESLGYLTGMYILHRLQTINSRADAAVLAEAHAPSQHALLRTL
ncbi:hypothetical protein B0H16DRAFT_1630202 [Mycena metata]|uniref:Uncharacterized protein n=1 Tax=Mycena metata TaxID=1033252 RepID=A0AAD7H2A6_9AGAR|nr:hypothetical protein B0H16DRAFT_1630202 [Mycena metata]